MIRFRTALRLAPLLLAFCSFSSFGAPPVAAAQPPKLGVLISIDGLSYSRLRDSRPWFTSGLKRLLEEGWNERGARYQHLNTETGPGHAALGTGAPPRVTGIVANRWFEAGNDGALHQVYCTDQPGPEGAGPIAGPNNLKTGTLGDALVASRPGARVVSLSGKDRGSIFLAGKDPRHGVYWFNQETGHFVSSAAYSALSDPGAAAARLVKKFNTQSAGAMLPGRFGVFWKKLAAAPPANRKLPRPVPDIEQLQFPVNGLGFDHDLSRNIDGYFTGFYYSPLVDELTMDLALTFLSDPELQFGHRDVPDLLCLSFSGQDTVSHNYGSESEENLDTLRRLDLQLGRLFDALDESFPAGTVVLALSADHGFSPIPEVEKKRDKKFAGGRLVTGRDALNPFLERLNHRLDQELCLDPSQRPLFGSEGWNISYSGAPLKSVEGSCGAAERVVTAREIDAVLPGVVARTFSEEVKEVLLTSKFESWPKDGDGAFARNDYFPSRSGDAVLIPRPGVLMHWDPGRGSGHGSHYEDNIHVPLIFWGGSLPVGGSDIPSTPYDLAPTLARLLGVKFETVGRALVIPR